MTTKRFYVDIADDCKGQEFSISRKPCFITGNPIVLVNGMGLYQSYLDNGETDIAFLNELLATVDCAVIAMREGL